MYKHLTTGHRWTSSTRRTKQDPGMCMMMSSSRDKMVVRLVLVDAHVLPHVVCPFCVVSTRGWCTVHRLMRLPMIARQLLHGMSVRTILPRRLPQIMLPLPPGSLLRLLFPARNPRNMRVTDGVVMMVTAAAAWWRVSA